MLVVICGSMSASHEMVSVKHKLIHIGHEVILPSHAEEYANGSIKMENNRESTQNKIEGNLIQEYFETIRGADAVLAVNVDKRGIRGYIGGNTFLEMGFAHVLGKKLFVLNEIPESPYRDEIFAMQPMVLEGDLSKLT